jgi:hypothetical protein
MANPEHLKVLKRGVETWNRWRKDHPDVVPDLGGAKNGRRRGALQGGTPAREDVPG